MLLELGSRAGDNTSDESTYERAVPEGSEMFSRPVVFIVGAGASAEFRMPAGGELKTKVAAAVNFGAAGTRHTGDQDLYKLLTDRNKSTDYDNAGRLLADVIPSFISIDEALNWFTSRSEILELGKIAIVREILTGERASRLFNASDVHSIPDADFDDTWLPHFLSMVMGSLNMEEAETAFRNVTVINFNYDRTIEHYVYSALQRQFGLHSKEAARVLSGLKMIRPYGQVGNLPWQDAESSVEFGMASGMNDYKRLAALSQGIRTYTEGELVAALAATIQPQMERARMVVFLGFGFHQQNMTILRARSAESWRRVFATALDMNLNNYPTMRSSIANTVGTLQEPLLFGSTARTLLVQLRPAIMAAAHM